MNTNSQQERTLRASSPPTLFLYLLLSAFCAIWILGILTLTGHRILSWNNITTLVGVAAWGLVWQGAYAIFRPHRPIVRKLYCASLAFWGVVILVYSVIQHHFKLDWLAQKTWPSPMD